MNFIIFNIIFKCFTESDNIKDCTIDRRYWNDISMQSTPTIYVETLKYNIIHFHV